MNLNWFRWIWLLGIIFFAADANAEPVKAGVIDLRKYEWENNELVKLNGEWNFYWKQFINPGALKAAETHCYVPASWNNADKDTAYSPLGYASYHLRLLLPSAPRDIALYTYSFASAYKAFANGAFIGNVGEPGKTPNASKPAFGTKTLLISNAKDTVDVVFHVSNFRRDKGGFWSDIKVGPAKRVQKQKQQKTLLETFLFASIFVIGLYHLIMFVNRQRDLSSLFFGLFSLLIALRLAVTGEYIIYQLMPLDWLTTFRMEYITFYAPVPFFGGYMYSLFRNKFWKPLAWIIAGIAAIFVGIVLFTPSLVFIKTVHFFQLITVVFSFYVVWLMIQGIRSKQRTSYVLLAGFIVFFGTIVNDIMYVNGTIESANYAPWGLLVFIFSQAYLISWRYSKSFTETESLSRELNEININLENRVEERTREIRLRNEEVLSQREELQAVAENLREANDQLNNSNAALSSKNKAITQSIQYAKRIQYALLPKDLARVFSDYFVFYLPRDIVSGDFYWVRRKRNKTFIVVADCTGHGVPGAFVSLLGITFLNEAMQQKILPDAKMMLELQRKKVKVTLNKSEQGRMRRDGMDMAVCIIDDTKREINYAGAHIPLYLIQNGELYNYKPDRMPVSIHHKEKGFQQHFFNYEAGTSLYFFSDGIVDQIGNGEKREKFKPRRLRELLLANHQKPMLKQKEALEQAFYNWKGDYPKQVDDLLVVGFRLE